MDMIILCVIMLADNVCSNTNGEYIVFILQGNAWLNVELAAVCSNVGDRFAY